MRRVFPKLTRPQKVVVALAVLFFVLGTMQAGRMALALRTAARLPDLPLTVSLDYLALTSGVWSAALLACAVGLVWFRPWGRWMALGASLAYQAHRWADRLLFDASDYALRTRPRDLVLTVLFLALVWGVLNWPSVRRVFRANL
ncbi:MAG: hypothetical protein JXD18_07650 [Anaerolineae bacterium]|nr:hypothetical protein [Anaerolineae bacterium]